MRVQFTTLYILSFVILCQFGVCNAAAENSDYDLVVYGGTSAGVIAAVQAKKMGKSVILVCPDTHLGGLSSGGLGATDIGNKHAIGGLSREFYRRLGKHYGKDEAWTFEPHVAEMIFDQLITENEITVHRNKWLTRTPGEGVKIVNDCIASITMLSGESYRGKMFIDATYEGDLMAAAGVSYTTGREANATYDETLNGVQTLNARKTNGRSHQFEAPVDPFVKPGDPASGLLPGVHAGGPGEEGAADERIQAYCFRMCLTDAPENRVPFPKPANYDPMRYELLLRTILAGANRHPARFFTTTRMPNRKTDSNNSGPFSTDNIGMNYEYPDADYETRRQIIDEHRTYQQGFMWFLANDPRVPEDLRKRVSAWGLAADEFTDNGNWPHQLYVREARRMLGAYVMTQNNCQGKIEIEDSIGMGAYTMDSHHVQRYVDENGHVKNEGDVQIGGFGPYPIAYGTIVPKQGECENLLVPVCLSASHIAFGSIRMEPVFMVLGQSAATAAVLAIDANSSVQEVDYPTLKAKLEQDGQRLFLPPSLARKPAGIPAPKLPGIVVDDSEAKMTGYWTAGTLSPVSGTGYLHDSDGRKGEMSLLFTAKVPKSGKYEVNLLYTAHANRSSKTPVVITIGDERHQMLVNQKESNGVGKTLGVFEVDSIVNVTVSNTETDGFVVVDGLQLLPKE